MSPSTPLALKVTTIVYNPPFQKFLDPPLNVHSVDILVTGKVEEFDTLSIALFLYLWVYVMQ